MVSSKSRRTRALIGDADEKDLPFHPLNLLNASDSVPGTLTQADLHRILKVGGFPESTVARLPSPADRADSFKEGWICFFEYPFRIGHSFPFSRLVQDFLVSLELAPCQVMPHTWRLLQTIDEVSSSKGIDFSFDALWRSYYLSTRGSCRFQLRPRRGKGSLVFNLDVNDRGWRSRFFFVERESLGGDFSFLLSGWRTSGIAFFHSFVSIVF